MDVRLEKLINQRRGGYGAALPFETTHELIDAFIDELHKAKDAMESCIEEISGYTGGKPQKLLEEWTCLDPTKNLG